MFFGQSRELIFRRPRWPELESLFQDTAGTVIINRNVTKVSIGSSTSSGEISVCYSSWVLWSVLARHLLKMLRSDNIFWGPNSLKFNLGGTFKYFSVHARHPLLQDSEFTFKICSPSTLHIGKTCQNFAGPHGGVAATTSHLLQRRNRLP